MPRSWSFHSLLLALCFSLFLSGTAMARGPLAKLCMEAIAAAKRAPSRSPKVAERVKRVVQLMKWNLGKQISDERFIEELEIVTHQVGLLTRRAFSKEGVPQLEVLPVADGEHSLNRVVAYVFEAFGTRAVFDSQSYRNGAEGKFDDDENVIKLFYFDAADGTPDKTFFHEVVHAYYSALERELGPNLLSGALLFKNTGDEKDGVDYPELSFSELATYAMDFRFDALRLAEGPLGNDFWQRVKKDLRADVEMVQGFVKRIRKGILAMRRFLNGKDEAGSFLQYFPRRLSPESKAIVTFQFERAEGEIVSIDLALPQTPELLEWVTLAERHGDSSRLGSLGDTMERSWELEQHFAPALQVAAKKRIDQLLPFLERYRDELDSFKMSARFCLRNIAEGREFLMMDAINLTDTLRVYER